MLQCSIKKNKTHWTGSFGERHFFIPIEGKLPNKVCEIRESRRARSKWDDKCEVANSGHKCDTAIEHNRKIYSHRMEPADPSLIGRRIVVVDNFDREYNQRCNGSVHPARNTFTVRKRITLVITSLRNLTHEITAIRLNRRHRSSLGECLDSASLNRCNCPILLVDLRAFQSCALCEF